MAVSVGTAKSGDTPAKAQADEPTPAPVNPRSGLCQWRELAASKQGCNTPMSKESEPADPWRHVFAAAAARPADYCTGCGYFVVVHGADRRDCIAEADAADEDAVTHSEAVANVINVLGVRAVISAINRTKGKGQQ